MTVATAHCSAVLVPAAFGAPAVPCGQQVGLVRIGGYHACPRHVAEVAAWVARNTLGQHRCGGYLGPAGCSNPACPEWRGPFA